MAAFSSSAVGIHTYRVNVARAQSLCTWQPAFARLVQKRPRPSFISSAALGTPLAARRTFFVRRRIPAAPGSRPRPAASSTVPTIRCVQQPPIVYEGRFGSFTIDDDDRKEVLVYRSSLVGVAAAACIAAALVDSGNASPEALFATLVAAQACLGVSLATIHIYMKPLHKMLQVMWGVGAASTLALGGALGPAALYNEPLTLLATGWYFVALTGLAFKEAVCFGRVEAIGVALLTPVLAGGHFLRVLPAEAEQALLSVIAPTLLFFAARKFGQRPEDDIGDKSVFEHLKRVERDPAANPFEFEDE